MPAFENIGDRAIVVGVHDPRDQQDGYGGYGVVYIMSVGYGCWFDATDAYPHLQSRIESVEAECGEWCDWCGGAG